MNKKGFTLIEIMIVLAIFGVLMIAASDMLINVLQNSAKSVSQNEVRQNANKIMQDITSQIRGSTGVTQSASPWTINGNTYTLNSGDLTKNGQTINTSKVSVQNLNIPTCSSSCQVTLTVQLKSDPTISITLNNTITPRQY